MSIDTFGTPLNEKEVIETPKIFELYWSWYEDYVPYLFYHPTKTKGEFESDVEEQLKKYGKEYLTQEESWASASEWIHFISNKMGELGYESITPAAVGFFGNYIIKDEEENKGWGEAVGKELLQAAIDHNNTIKEQMRKENYELE